MSALFIDSRRKREAHVKSWGYEEWIVNNDLYCGKRLHFEREGGCTSLHLHRNKHETMYVERGKFQITVIDQARVEPEHYVLSEGDSLVIEPMTIHRITALKNLSVLVEFSTHHEDSDSYRVSR